MSDLNRKRKVLVTGGAGFIGSEYIAQRVAQWDQVLVLDSLSYAGHPINIDAPLKTGRAELVRGDIGDSDLVSRLLAEFQPDAVINFAAESHVDRSIEGPEAFVQTNIVGTFRLLNTAYAYWSKLPAERKSSFRYVQISTDEVFGSLGETGYFSETTPIAPNSPYSASKAAADALVRAWFHTYGMPTITTHCSNNYGPRQYPEKLIPTMIRAALAGKRLPVYGDGKNIRDWIHVADHSRGIHLALERGRPGEIYCFGGRSERNNNTVVQAICSHLDRIQPRKDGQSYSTQIAYVEDRLGHDRRYAIDDARAEKELGFSRQYERFEDGLKETVDWYVDNAAWCETVMSDSAKAQK